MKLLLFCLIFLPQILNADTYLYRVAVTAAQPKSTVDTFFSGKGLKSDQPFLNTYTLRQADTNYVLVKITPQDANEDANAKVNFGLANADLYQIYRIVDGLPTIIVDNSTKFSVNTDWSVFVSCPTVDILK